MKCTSCDNNLDLANNGFAVREDCMHTVCLDCSSQKICGACFKAQQLQQKKIHEEKQAQVAQSTPVAPKLQKPVQPQLKKQVKAEVGLRKVKIGNLPYSTTTEELSSIFSLCGGIEETLVFPFTDFKGEERNYGLITFNTEKAAKLALLHHNKVFRGHVITVASNKDATYSIFVSNYPSGNDKDNVMAFFKAYGEVKSVGKQQESKFFINFAEDEVRRNVMASNLQVPSKLGLVTLNISLKEPPKQTGTIGGKPEGDGFPLFLKEIPARLGSKPLIEAMFELFGPITAKQMTFSKETHTVTWKIEFPTAVLRDQALLFNNRRPNKWNVNITLSIETQKGSSKNLQEKIAKTAAPLIQKTAKITTKSTPTIASTKKALAPGTSKGTITTQRSSKKEKASSQPTLNAQKFGIRVTGFDTTVKEEDLEGYFADAGTIMECKVEISKNGSLTADIAYSTEDEMNKAISWSPCLFGYPSQTLIIHRLI